jgi:chromosome segregation ATPase
MIHTQKETIADREREIGFLKREFQEVERQLIDGHESEKAQIIDTYKQSQTELQRQCDTHRNDIQRLAEELTKSERRTKDAKAQASELKRDVLKLEKDIRAQEEQIEREKRLHEAALRALALKAESDYTTKLNEQKARADNDERRIFAYVADSFKQFFNLQDIIDERSYRQVVNRAKEELTSLSEINDSVRRIVRASSHQKTDDAVAQAFFGRN